jgi:hypothetical protein
LLGWLDQPPRGRSGEKVVVFRASNDREINAAFAAIAQVKVGAMLVGGGAFLTSRRRQIIGLAALHKIPAIYVTRQHTEAGGLMSYGASTRDAYRRAGVYVARILKGEKPGDLPVELPTKFELVINLKTAKDPRTRHSLSRPTARRRADRVNREMSAFGPKRASIVALQMSAFGGKADIAVCENPLSQSLLGVKRTCRFALHMSANDPKRTSG